VVVDVGGGSTELITDSFRASLDVGCVRLTERHGSDLEAMAADVRSALPPLRAARALNVDGTTAELAALAGGRTVTLAEIDEALAWLSESTDAERRARLIEPERSDVLAAGVVVVRETLHHLGLTETTASDRDLLNGVALAAARLPEPSEGEAPPGAYTCC
jgi:exopolyphosphatase / guanosine-5'-triphosphate,3'-diphosphate pyrophosphatase